MSSYQLSTGAILKIGQGAPQAKELYLQILNVSRMPGPNPGAEQRVRVILSDGKHCTHAMIANKVPTAEKDKITINCIIKATDALVSEVHNRMVCVILAMEVVDFDNKMIGHPSQIDFSQLKDSSTLPPPQQQQQRQYQPPPQPQPQHQQAPPQHQQAPQQHHQVQRQQYRPPQPQQHADPDDLSVQDHLQIRDLTRYSHGWIIQARVSKISNLRQFGGGKGTLFNVELFDNSGEIKATAFNDDAHRLFSLLEKDQTFYIKGGNLKEKNPRFNRTSHALEILFGRNTVVQKCSNNTAIKQKTMKLSPLNVLDKLPKNSFCDVMGVVTAILPPRPMTTKNGDTTLHKIQISDNSTPNERTSVEISFWGEMPAQFQEGQIVKISECRKTNYNNVSLTASRDSNIIVNPEDQKSAQLSHWYKQFGTTAPEKKMTENKPRSSGKPQHQLAFLHEGIFESMDNYQIDSTCYVVAVGRNKSYYQCCPNEGCNKKVEATEDGNFFCPKCQQTFESCDYRYILKVKLQDSSGSEWVTFFNKAATSFLDTDCRDYAGYGDDQRSMIQDDVSFKQIKTTISARRSYNEDNYDSNINYSCPWINEVYPRSSAYQMLRDINDALPKIQNS